MTTVVTGAAGHLGGNLCRALLEHGEAVRATVHRDTRALEGLDLETVQADIQDIRSLRKAFAGAQTVIHLAAKISIAGDPDGSVHRANVDGARHAAEAALDAGVSRFVHVSSVHAYDLPAVDRLTEESPKAGRHNYAYDYSKAQGEAQVQAMVRQGLDAVIVNPTGVMGPIDHKPGRMGQVFLDLAHRRLPALVKGSFDWVDVRDVASSIIQAADVGKTGENYLLGGHQATLRELALLAQASTQVLAPRWTLPPGVAKLGIPFAAAAARRHHTAPRFTAESIGTLQHCPIVDHSKARRELGHRPRPAARTVDDIYDWFRGQGLVA